MISRTSKIGLLITDSIYALYEVPSTDERAFIVSKTQSEIEDDIVNYVKADCPGVTDSQIRDKISLYLFMAPADNGTMCKLL